jgi:glycosyltransferase involved in cell wall biosynthesis
MSLELPPKALLLIPAYNEEGAIARVVVEVRQLYPDLPILVVDDCSTDATAALARDAGARVLLLPCHLGLGGCVQAGYKLAFELGYEFVVRIDGDGQHDPRDLPRLLGTLQRSGADMVIGVRAPGSAGFRVSIVRRLGIAFFKLLLRPILGRPVTDPTSGFVAVGPRALALFSRTFPLEYPEIEALVVLQRRAFRFEEVPCVMRSRLAGRSSITAVKSLYYVIHVLLGVFVNILRYDAGARRRRPS